MKLKLRTLGADSQSMNRGSPEKILSEKILKAESVRIRFREWIATQTAHDLPEACLETILVQSSRYAGRRFSMAGFSLMWMIDQRQIQLFGIDGDLIFCEAVEDFCKLNICKLDENFSTDASDTTATKSPSGPAEV